MEDKSKLFSVYPGGQHGLAGAAPGREYEELWFQIARIPWASVVLVPVQPGSSAADIATSLAQVGTRLRDTPVTAIVADSMDYASARSLAEMQPRLNDGRDWSDALAVEHETVAPAGQDGQEPPIPRAAAMPPFGRAIISIRAVVDEPLGVAVAQAADAVVLCFELGTSSLAAARRTIELIGRKRIIGAFVVR